MLYSFLLFSYNCFLAPKELRNSHMKNIQSFFFEVFTTINPPPMLQGFILLSVQAHLPQLRPPSCDMVSDGVDCVEAKGYKALIFFLALYLVALGSGCLKPNIISHGADQFKKEDPKQSKKLSTYFNVAYFAFCIGELLALTVLVWVQTHSGMDVGFGVSAAAMAVGLICLISGSFSYRNKPPKGSIFTPFAQVISFSFLL